MAANAVPVAEYTVAQIILANKGCFQRMQRVGDWSNKWPKNPMLGNYGADIGIVGAGMIGKLVIKMLRAYRLNVFVFDPFLSEEEAAELGATKLGSLTELFARCQVISNHLANNAETVGMLNAECFNAMKKNGVFINTGRGAQVVETELVAAMRAEPERARSARRDVARAARGGQRAVYDGEHYSHAAYCRLSRQRDRQDGRVYV